MDKEQTKQAILGFAEFFKGITGNQNLEIPSEIEELHFDEYKMRDATPEEQEAIDKYIKSISKPTGIDFDEEQEELDFVQPHKSIPCTIKMADGEITDDDIATMRILFNADIECLCNQGRFNDAKEMEQIRDRLMASLQVDGEYISKDTIIDWLKEQDIIKTDGQEKEARKQLDELPSVVIPNKAGHWIKYGKLYQCSKCKELSCCQGKFCNECGTKMVEEQEG
jgi:hypothetical protein